MGSTAGIVRAARVGGNAARASGATRSLGGRATEGRYATSLHHAMAWIGIRLLGTLQGAGR